MSALSHLRDALPRYWWRSPRWWWDGVVELGRWLLMLLVTVIFVRRAAQAARNRDNPRHLAQLDDEKFTAGLVVNSVAAGAMIAGVLDHRISDEIIGVLVCWSLLCVLNAVVAAVVIGTLVRSRLHRRVEWSMLDWADDHQAPEHRPPETAEEYEAARLRSLLDEGSS